MMFKADKESTPISTNDVFDAPNSDPSSLNKVEELFLPRIVETMLETVCWACSLLSSLLNNASSSFLWQATISLLQGFEVEVSFPFAGVNPSKSRTSPLGISYVWNYK